MDANSPLHIQLPAGRWTPGCGIPGCQQRPSFAVEFTREALGHVHACPPHARAVLMWRHIGRITALPASNSAWHGWCALCELPSTNRWTAQWW